MAGVVAYAIPCRSSPLFFLDTSFVFTGELRCTAFLLLLVYSMSRWSCMYSVHVHVHVPGGQRVLIANVTTIPVAVTSDFISERPVKGLEYTTLYGILMNGLIRRLRWLRCCVGTWNLEMLADWQAGWLTIRQLSAGPPARQPTQPMQPVSAIQRMERPLLCKRAVSRPYWLMIYAEVVSHITPQLGLTPRGFDLEFPQTSVLQPPDLLVLHAVSFILTSRETSPPFLCGSAHPP